jgi:hypothetical protein
MTRMFLVTAPAAVRRPLRGHMTVPAYCTRVPFTLEAQRIRSRNHRTFLEEEERFQVRQCLSSVPISNIAVLVFPRAEACT